MSKTEKETQIVIEDGVNTTKMEANISWYESYICDSSNHMYTSEDGKIYNFTIVYNTKDATLYQISKLSELMESLISSKTVRVCNTSYMNTYFQNTDAYYFTNFNQYNKVVTNFNK